MAKASSPALNILMIASEALPFSKTGGLADVAGALPRALAHAGHTTTLAVPRYRTGNAELQQGTPIGSLDVQFPIRTLRVDVIERPLGGGALIWFLDCPALYDRDNLYGVGADYEDSPLRFATLCRAAIEMAIQRGSRVDVIHAHDWQGGLAPIYAKHHYGSNAVTGSAGTVFTIHNIAYQGVHPREWIPALGLDWGLFHPGALEFWGSISLLKAGVVFSDVVTTVSRRYAEEIQTPGEYAYGFDGIMRHRRADLVGITNGIDTDLWNPETDPHLPEPYSVDDLKGKDAAKRLVLERFGLPTDADAMKRPLVGMVTRLVDQKGLDLLGWLGDPIVALDASFVVLGTGESRYQDFWRWLSSRAPHKIAVRIGFDEALAHQIEAGADIFMMPSRFEPCGLNQMYSLRYGTVPLVRATGGLDDTVVDVSEGEEATGFKFSEYSPDALRAALERALSFFRDKTAWKRLQTEGMRRDHSWDASAQEYVKVYEKAIQARQAAVASR